LSSFASRAKRHAGSGPSAQTLGVTSSARVVLPQRTQANPPMDRKRVHIGLGEVFLVPLAPERFGVGQVVEVIEDLGVACVFFDELLASTDCDQASLLTPIAFATTFTHELKRGLWKPCATRPVPNLPRPWPHEHRRARHWVGLSFMEGGLVADYLAFRLGVAAPKPYQQEPGYEARFALN
jgi:hypothetical protein